MSVASELEVQRKLTRDFIARNPVVITLTTQVKQSNGAGGWRKVAGSQRVPQTVTLIPQTGGGGTGPTRTAEGEADIVDFVLLAEWDALVAEGDSWSVGPMTYRVEFVFPPNGYETRAGVKRYGT